MNDKLKPDEEEQEPKVVDLGYYGGKKRKASDDLNMSQESDESLDRSKNRLTLKKELGYAINDDNEDISYSQREETNKRNKQKRYLPAPKMPNIYNVAS